MKRRQFIQQSLILISAAPAFAGLNSSPVDVRFAIASDAHYGQADTPFDLHIDNMMGWLRTEHEHQPLAFCLFNGDHIQDDPALFEPLRKKYESLQIPYHVSRGNHDRCDEQLWKKNWGRDLNYSFGIKKNAFVILDTSNVSGDLICPDLDWVRQTFDQHKKKENLFVFMHVPPKRWTVNGVDCEELMRVFAAQSNLKAVFHGHEHNADDAKFDQGKPYLFDSHIGGNWGTAYHGYRIVEVLKSGEILTYQVNPGLDSKVNTNKIGNKK